jgi:two-component system, NtrC family, sensor kinase
LYQLDKVKIGWLRLHIAVDSSIKNTILSLAVNQVVASEFYLNGKYFGNFGKISPNPDKVEAYSSYSSNTLYQVIHLYIDEKNSQTLSVKFALQNSKGYYGNYNPLLKLVLFKSDEKTSNTNTYEKHGEFDASSLDYFKAGIFFILSIFHLFFYFSSRIQKANLSFGLFCLFITLLLLYQPITFQYFNEFNHRMNFVKFFWFLYLIPLLILIYAVYQFFFLQKKAIFYALTILVFGYLSYIIFFIKYNFSIGFYISILLNLEITRVSIKALNNKKKGAIFFVFGTSVYVVCMIVYIFYRPKMYEHHENQILSHLMFNLGSISIPISMALVLAREFAQTARSLALKLRENEALSEEKQHILATQNETLEKQVAERTAELKASQNQLIQKEKLASLGELTAGIAHEIQNPLNFVNNFSELSVDLVKDLKDEFKRPDKDESYIDELFDDLSQNQEKINLHGKRASNIVKGMLEHSRTSTGVKEPTDINKLVDESLRLSYHAMRAKDKSFNADFKMELDEDLAKIEVIPQDMGRVLLNLINNAFYAVHQKNLRGFENLEGLKSDYTPSVVVSTFKKEGFIEIKVQDNGSGIPDAIKSKIFQPFFTTKPTGEGTGLGLSLSYDIVTKGHGGTLEVDSTEGAGSEFIITLSFKTNG